MIPDVRLWMVKRGMVKGYQRGEKDAEEETEETSAPKEIMAKLLKLLVSFNHNING